MAASLVLLMLLFTGARGDVACTNGAIANGAQGADGTQCNCNAGYFGGGDVSAGSYADCTECGAGEYQDQAGQSTCIACLKGKYRDESEPKSAAETTACKNCAQGEYQPADGQTSCIACAAGKFQDGSGNAL